MIHFRKLFSRRKFFKKSISLGASLFFFRNSTLSKGINSLGIEALEEFPSKRPPIAQRKFHSERVESKILEIKSRIKNPKFRWIFENCFPNTLDTTVYFKKEKGVPDTFIITGDIQSMWLRDSSAQVWPYLRLLEKDPQLKELIQGLIRRQSSCILLDPYANAFNWDEHTGEVYHDLTDIKPGIHERKWEIDSLCYPIRLAYHYWKITGDKGVFDDPWKKAAQLIVQTFRDQQRKKGSGPYHFQRETAVQSDTIALGGYGNPIKPNGLICSIFRPSDDATLFSFLIPSNLFASKILLYMAEIFEELGIDPEFSKECRDFSGEIQKALKKFGIYNHPELGQILAYEVDGYGNQLMMDDANAPSLLSLPYLGLIDPQDPLYIQTRKYIWSDRNPYFFQGKLGEGIGGPHVGLGYIWPMSIIMKAITSQSALEIQNCLYTLLNTDANTGFMHESFYKDDDKNFTRSWFAWVNTLFGELVLKVEENFPEILEGDFLKKG